MRFQNLPNTPEAKEADVVLLPLPFEKTVTAGEGTSLAPAAIVESGMDIEYFEEEMRWSPFRHLTLHVTSTFAPLHEFDALFRTIESTLGEVRKNALLITLGGEHSISPFVTARRFGAPGTVVVFDAHADFRASYRGERYNHACAVYHMRAQGHRILSIGLRSFFEDEMERMERDAGVEFYTDMALRSERHRAELLRKLEGLEGEVYVSIDMDAFSPAVVPGVGTPQPGGLSWYFFLDCLKALLMNGKTDIRGVDLVEMVPDPMRISQVTAAKIVQKTVSYWGVCREYHKIPQRGSQMSVEYE
ncbi:arginase family protein [Hydrogenimonas sp.]